MNTKHSKIFTDMHVLNSSVPYKKNEMLNKIKQYTIRICFIKMMSNCNKLIM